MKEYTFKSKAGIGAAMDVRTWGGRIYSIQSKIGGGRLCVLSEELEVLYTYEGIGNCRQIEIKNGIAFVTARENGLWIFDLRAEEPILLSHYCTVEYATGITLYKNYAFVSCRQYGIEIIDVTMPDSPRYIGVIRIGEAQSACVYNDVIYGGVWGEMKVVAVDISDVTNPQVIGEYPVTGRADGVIARDGVLYASTGQHRRGIVNSENENDPCFGIGYGVEMFDIKDPRDVKNLGWISFTKGFSISFDMWKPMLCGDTLVCNSSVVGVWGIDTKTGNIDFHISMPEGEAATGTAVMGGKLYVTAGNGDLYLFDEIPLADSYRYDSDGTYAADSPDLIFEAKGGVDAEQILHTDFPILSASALADKPVLACGNGGIMIIDTCGKPIVSYSDGDFCYDAVASGNYVYGAFGSSGIKIFTIIGDTLSQISSLDLGATVQQLAITHSGNYLAAAYGGNKLKMINVTNPTTPEIAYSYVSNRGLLYGENFLAHTYGGAGITLFWHRLGLVYSDPDRGDREFHYIAYPMQIGFCGFCPDNGCDILGDDIFFAHKGGYILLNETEEYADSLPVYCAEERILGKFTIADNVLITTERAGGIITLTDVTDPKSPRHIGAVTTNATPSRALVIGSDAFIPLRYGGLLRLRVK